MSNGIAESLLMLAPGPFDEDALATRYFLSSSRDGYARITILEGADNLRCKIRTGERIRIIAALPAHSLDLQFGGASGTEFSTRVSFKSFSADSVPFHTLRFQAACDAPDGHTERKEPAGQMPS